MSDLNELVSMVASGRYVPSPGTVGARLAELECACGSRSVQRFAAAAYRHRGLAWPLYLEAGTDALSEAEADYVAMTFKQWVTGGRPFRRRVRNDV